MPVVVVHEPIKNPLKVLLVQNQQPVETFRAAVHEPLGNPIGLRRVKWGANDLNPFATEHVVKLVGEFPVPIANQEPHRLRAPRQGP
jgi:hypothetical protein